MLISKEEFDKIFPAEYKRLLLECVNGGLGDYNNLNYYSAEARRDHTPSARAILRHCHIVARMNRTLMERHDIRVLNRRGRILFIFNDKLQCSIKKFDSRLRTSSNPTKQADDFKAQLPLDLDEPAELANFFTGYKYDRAEAYYDVYITYPHDEQNYWEWKISGAEIKEFMLNPSANIDDIGTVSMKKRRVHIRQDAQKEAKDAG
ncbi:MAG TPA: hypothetical protein VNE38_02400 [Ktedonobacteraceae bacterium]|nr:hypothetical protein [Ktedonobacteraceae bacterium]